LAAAAARPFTMVGGQFVFDNFDNGLLQAAALLKAVAQYHAFNDANKRTAYTTTLYFLRVCGYRPRETLLSRREMDDLEQFILWVSREHEDREAGAPAQPYEIPALAAKLDSILGPSQRRRGRLARLRSGAYHLFYRR